MHFIFQIILTRKQFKVVWKMVVENLCGRCQRFAEITRGLADRVVTDDVKMGMGELLPLIGVDLHPYNNAEQGLAMAFSCKTEGGTTSSPMRIIHVTGGEEMMSEVPCRNVWRAARPMEPRR